jgi:hydroxyacylglutathione hydrolase
MIKVIAVPAFSDNYIWLIYNPHSSSVVIVDPGDATPVISHLENLGLRPEAILITHHHDDHIGGINQLTAKYDISVYGPKAERIAGITIPLNDGDKIKLDGLKAKFKILSVPGHTLGHIAYYGHNMLFIGDTLFMSGCGRLFEGTPKQMYHSLKKISNLPDHTEIYCAHEYTLANLRFARAVEPDNIMITNRLELCTQLRKKNLPTVPGTVGEEKNTNPFLRVHIPEIITAAEKFAGHDLHGDVEVFANIRSWKDNF